MPHSLRARLKNLVYKGVLSEKDLSRIEILSSNKNERMIQAAKILKEYCKSNPSSCDTCIFKYLKYEGQEIIFHKGCKLQDRLPEGWEIEGIKNDT